MFVADLARRRRARRDRGAEQRRRVLDDQQHAPGRSPDRLRTEPSQILRGGRHPEARAGDRQLSDHVARSGADHAMLDEERIISEGDCALIAPGSRHKVFNVGAEPLRLVCACSPAYSDEDTHLTE
jgi:hypothetical protein